MRYFYIYIYIFFHAKSLKLVCTLYLQHIKEGREMPSLYVFRKKTTLWQTQDVVAAPVPFLWCLLQATLLCPTDDGSAGCSYSSHLGSARSPHFPPRRRQAQRRGSRSLWAPSKQTSDQGRHARLLVSKSQILVQSVLPCLTLREIHSPRDRLLHSFLSAL